MRRLSSPRPRSLMLHRFAPRPSTKSSADTLRIRENRRLGAAWCTSCSRAAECCAHAVSGDAPNMCVELRCESRNCERTTAIPDTLQVRALAYDHYCDLQRPPKGAASSRRRRCPHTAVFSPLFSRGDIDRRAFRRAPPPSATGVREAPPKYTGRRNFNKPRTKHYFRKKTTFAKTTAVQRSKRDIRRAEGTTTVSQGLLLTVQRMTARSSKYGTTYVKATRPHWW